MPPPRRQAEAAARQTVGLLIGSLLGFGIAAKLVMGDPDAMGTTNPWAGALLVVLACGVGGVLVAGLMNSSNRVDTKPKPPPKDKPQD